MSQVLIRAALETALATLSPALATSYENKAFKPPAQATPYQAVYMRFAKPENVEQGGGYNEIGYMQVTLFYPQTEGPTNAAARAKMIRDLFKKATAFTSGGVKAVVTATPEIGNGTEDGDRWALAVKIPFMAQIYT